MASTSPLHRRRKSWGRKLERCCCSTFAYIPLVFVYGLTTWAVIVAANVSLYGQRNVLSFFSAALAIVLYSLLAWSYTTAVFTSPGSPIHPKLEAARRKNGGGYEGLPSYEEEADLDFSMPEGANDDDNGTDDGGRPAWMGMTTVTAKSTGKPRFCKKCRCVKPDRSHHCSSCGVCVLKMDHHCPWLATCVGLRNYKAFLLFLTYTSLFCWCAFIISAHWVWAMIADDVKNLDESIFLVNTILLAVLSGIIGLVLSGFTGWHIYLTLKGQTTIESLERTRYLTPLRKTMERQFQQSRNYIAPDGSHNKDVDPDDQPLSERLKEIHANALPGVLRPEEGEVSLRPNNSSSPAHESLSRSYASLEAQRERDRYHSYLDEKDSETLPNAFDNGWKRNALHVMGEKPLYWFVPICNTSGDGWAWEVSPKWTEARARLERAREQRAREEAAWSLRGETPIQAPPPPRDLRWTPGVGFAERGREEVQMQPLDRRKEEMDTNTATATWNDIPEGFLDNGRGRGKKD